MRSIALVLICWMHNLAQSLSENPQPPKSNKWEKAVSSRLSPPTCKDKIAKPLCKKYDQYCDVSEALTKLCPRTCGVCKAISPLPCNQMPYGCCWDGVTYAAGPNQKGCPACKDRSSKCAKYATKKNCNAYQQIKRACPLSCGLCEGCRDHPKHRSFCPVLKKSGFCETTKDIMKKQCRKTCNFCKEL